MSENLIALSAIFIAICSLLLSFYLMLRDRTNRKYDNLYTCRKRILELQNNEDVYTSGEVAEFTEDNPDTDEAERFQLKSIKQSFLINRELEFACYMVIKKQIDYYAFLIYSNIGLKQGILTGVVQENTDKKNIHIRGNLFSFMKERECLKRLRIIHINNSLILFDINVVFSLSFM